MFLSISYEGECCLWDLRNPFKPLYVIPYFRGYSSSWGIAESVHKFPMPLIGSGNDGTVRILNYSIPQSHFCRESEEGHIIWEISLSCDSPPEFITCDAEGNIIQSQIPKQIGKKKTIKGQVVHRLKLDYKESVLHITSQGRNMESNNQENEKKQNELKTTKTVPESMVGIHRIQYNKNEGASRWIAFGGQAGLLHCMYVPKI